MNIHLKLGQRYPTTIQELFQNAGSTQTIPGSSNQQFWHAFFSVDYDRNVLTELLIALPKDECLHAHKSVLNSLFIACVEFAQRKGEDAAARGRAIETLTVIVRCVLAKHPMGWEVMEIFAGDMNKSDKIFMALIDMIAEYLEDEDAPADLRHRALLLLLTYACGISQLSPGAYLLRRDLFPSIVKLVKSPDTEHSLGAVVLLSLLANFHKSDAAKLNPYVQRIQSTSDTEFMRRLCRTAHIACDATVVKYQEIMDDSVPTLTKAVGTMIASLRPDRAFSSQPLDPPKELFKEQPVEASVALLPLFDFLYGNPMFTRTFLDTVPSVSEKASITRMTPLPYTTLSLASYLLTHASSSASRRAISYANLAMNMLLVMSENARVMEIFCQPSTEAIRLCRQRQPPLAPSSLPCPPICALLDCCILWLRHNLHKHPEISIYITCIWTCHRVIWYLQKVRIRLVYRWQELWSALLGLLNFLSSKADILVTTGDLKKLIQETVCLLDFGLSRADVILPSPVDTHTFVYELMRASHMLRKHMDLLQSLGQADITDRKAPLRSNVAAKALRHLLYVTSYYQGQLPDTTADSAKAALRTISKLIDKDGLHGVSSSYQPEDLVNRAGDVTGFVRFAYGDALSLTR